jgi:hypothetical protein
MFLSRLARAYSYCLLSSTIDGYLSDVDSQEVPSVSLLSDGLTVASKKRCRIKVVVRKIKSIHMFRYL